MKYVIFKHKELFMPVIIPEHVTHSDVKIEDAEPVSAGFFHIGGEERVTVFGLSESLGLRPNIPIDRHLLMLVLSGSGTSQFLDFNM